MTVGNDDNSQWCGWIMMVAFSPVSFTRRFQ
jgi:hypothetical protein